MSTGEGERHGEKRGEKDVDVLYLQSSQAQTAGLIFLIREFQCAPKAVIEDGLFVRFESR